MCSSYVINEVRVETGAGLITVIGAVDARKVNPNIGPHAISEADWQASCLCHVNQDALEEVTGRKFVYSGDDDAFVPSPSTNGGE